MVIKSIKTNKELSFGRLIDEGKTKEEICKLKNLTPEAYEKALDSLMKIREEKRKAAESQSVEVIIEGRKGLYRMEQKEFISQGNPDDKIPIDFREVPKIIGIICPTCRMPINKLDYIESGAFDFSRTCFPDKPEYILRKTEYSCPECHIPFNNKDVLRATGEGAMLVI